MTLMCGLDHSVVVVVMSQYVIFTDNPRCTLGYYGPYPNLDEANHYFDEYVRFDRSLAPACFATKEQLSQRAAEVAAKRAENSEYPAWSELESVRLRALALFVEQNQAMVKREKQQASEILHALEQALVKRAPEAWEPCDDAGGVVQGLKTTLTLHEFIPSESDRERLERIVSQGTGGPWIDTITLYLTQKHTLLQIKAGHRICDVTVWGNNAAPCGIMIMQ